MMEEFTSDEIEVGSARIFVRFAGKGPPVLLLHGFPETSSMWRAIAPRFLRHFSVVCADLRGYGRSSCPVSAPDFSSYAKRTLAHDMVTVMDRLGFRDFSVAGHDRGGRVAYRMALDHPARIRRLAVLDILPIETVWERADARLALGYWPWSLLAQPEPLPERILGAAADAIVDNALAQWGSASTAFPPAVRDEYVQVLRDREHAHAICEEYRAAATIDREHDRIDRAAGRRISCPMLVLWSSQGPLDTWYGNEGGPVELWRAWADQVQGHPLPGGHFFPEQEPERTAEALHRFFA
jgi:haloacetate dehalogenase